MSLELFQSIGLSETKAKETLANTAVSKLLEDIIIQVNIENESLNKCFFAHVGSIVSR